MKESYVKGLANHNDLESCDGWSNPSVEALTEETVGWGLSWEKPQVGDGGDHNQPTAKARGVGILRSRRPQAGGETTGTGTGRSCPHPRQHTWVASRSLRNYGDEER